MGVSFILEDHVPGTTSNLLRQPAAHAAHLLRELGRPDLGHVPEGLPAFAGCR